MRLRTTAPPMRPEVTNPARHGPEFSAGIAFNIRSLPRCVMPFCFTRSYSERCVRRRAFGKENKPASAILIGNSSIARRAISRCRALKLLRAGAFNARLQYKRSLPPKIGGRLLKRKESRQFMARATQQVFPLCQLAIQW